MAEPPRILPQDASRRVPNLLHSERRYPTASDSHSEARMREFQVVILRLQGKVREDEDAMTDLMNERARMGWDFHSIQPLPEQKVVVVFSRDA